MTDNFEIDILDLSSSELEQFEIIDIREPGEDPTQMMRRLVRNKIIDAPLSMFDLKHPPVEQGKKYIVICQGGARSRGIVLRLREAGFDNVYCVSGGADAFRKKFIA
jgi:rhodanese-related sulfurtransferase